MRKNERNTGNPHSRGYHPREADLLRHQAASEALKVVTCLIVIGAAAYLLVTGLAF